MYYNIYIYIYIHLCIYYINLCYKYIYIYLSGNYLFDLYKNYLYLFIKNSEHIIKMNIIFIYFNVNHFTFYFLI